MAGFVPNSLSFVLIDVKMSFGGDQVVPRSFVEMTFGGHLLAGGKHDSLATYHRWVAGSYATSGSPRKSSWPCGMDPRSVHVEPPSVEDANPMREPPVVRSSSQTAR